MSKIWTFVAYQKEDKTPEGSPRFFDIVRIKVYDFVSESLALKAAKKLVKRKGYRLEEVSDYIDKEHLESHKRYKEVLEYNKKFLTILTKFIKKNK